jgi:ABC-type dipeptide/oligopeptide/nickel transport system permease subunit
VGTAEQKPDRIGAGAGLAGAIEAESGAEIGELDVEIRARGYWEQVWRRFRRDGVAIASIVFLVLLVLLVYPGAWLAEQLIGHGPNQQFTDGITSSTTTFIGQDGEVITAQGGGIPVGPWSTVHHPLTGEEQILVLGASDTLGRDEFLRLLYGGRVSLQVAVLSTIGAVSLGVFLGAVAGYYRGWVDTIISRLTEITMAFPVLLFAIALASTVGTRLDNVTFGFLGRGVVTLVLVFTVFGWFFPARIMRAKVLSLREKEFIEAAMMTGASNWRVIRSHLLPHLAAPIIVFSTLIVATYILGEAALSFLGVGIKLPTPSWGNLLATAPEFYTTQPWLMLWPGLAVILTTLAFNLLGDGLRDAFDPRSRM